MFTHTGPRRTMLSAEVNFAKQIAKLEKMDEFLNYMLQSAHELDKVVREITNKTETIEMDNNWKEQ